MSEAHDRDVLVANIRQLADIKRQEAESCRSVATAIDTILTIEAEQCEKEVTTSRPPNPDEYRIRAEEAERKAAFFEYAAGRIESHEADESLLLYIREMAERTNRPMRHSNH